MTILASISEECYYEACDDCVLDTCVHHCHLPDWDWPALNWRRLENAWVTATDERGEPLL